MLLYKFKYVLNSLLNHFYDVTLKPLSDNSNIYVLLMLASVDYLLSFKFEIFLILGMMTEFSTEAWNLRYYVMRLWILFKSCVLAGLL